MEGMRAGKLRKRVTIQALTTAANDYGEMVETWSTAATVWGSLEPLLTGTREAFTQAGSLVQARVSYQCRVRYRALSPVTNRLVVEGRTFEVAGVLDPDGRGAELLALCYEVQS